MQFKSNMEENMFKVQQARGKAIREGKSPDEAEAIELRKIKENEKKLAEGLRMEVAHERAIDDAGEFIGDNIHIPVDLGKIFPPKDGLRG